MFRYKLRTLLMMLAILPPLLAVVGVTFFGLKEEPPSASGKVCYRGMPAASVAVTFTPNSGSGPSHAATTDAAGRYRIDCGTNEKDASARRLQR